MADFNDTHLRAKRLGFRLGKALAATDFALHANWGASATVSNVVAGSTDMAGEITITAAGAGPGASPTVILTFADGAFSTPDGADLVPLALCQRNGGSQTTVDFTWSVSKTALTMTFAGTPVAAQTFTVAWRLSA